MKNHSERVNSLRFIVPPSDYHSLEYLVLRILWRDFIQYKPTLDFPLLRSFGNSCCKEVSLPARYESLSKHFNVLWEVGSVTSTLRKLLLVSADSHLNPKKEEWAGWLSGCLVHSAREQHAAETRKLTLQICRVISTTCWLLCSS